MQLLSNPNNIGFFIFAVSFLLLNWKYFLKSYSYNKIFDFTFMFIIVGYFFERFYFVLLNRQGLLELGWSGFISLDKLPFVVLNLDKYLGFSPVTFLMGGLIGLFFYNWINTVNKVDFKCLEGILKAFLISLLPWIFLLVIKSVLLSETSENEQSLLAELIPSLIRLLVIIFMIGLYRVKAEFWESKPGFFACVLILLFVVAEIFIDYLDPDFTPAILNLFSVEQVFSILLIIFAINIFLTAVSNVQDSIIRKKMGPAKQVPSRGFALSFANKRRVSNPLNIRLKNLTKNSSRNRESREP